MAVGVYIDGFNFYYRVFRNDRRIERVPARYKWLNLEKLAEILMPREKIDYVGYFTAPVDPNSGAGKSARQRAYLLALESLPRVEVVLGYFRWVHHKGTRHPDGSGMQETFWHWEEKGSDVNIAMRMVRDACQRRFDKIVLVSNDSDLMGPTRMVNKDLGVPVIQCSPDVNVNRALRDAAHHSILLQPRRLSACLLPETVILPNGSRVYRPSKWS